MKPVKTTRMQHIRDAILTAGPALRATLRRFPLPSLAALAGFSASAWIVNAQGDSPAAAVPALLAAVVLFMASIALRTAFEEHFPGKRAAYVASNIALASGAVLYAAWLSSGRYAAPTEELRYVCIALAAFGAIFWIPCIGKAPSTAGNYAISIALRIGVAFVLSAVLFAGVGIALLTAETLLSVGVPWHAYLTIWCVCALLAAPAIFLSGVPRSAEETNTLPYPRELRILVSYILLPLITVYLAILYVYFAKAAVTWTIPRGIVTYLILGYSTAGIIILFLVSPAGKLKENSWIGLYSHWFYRALVPLIAVLYAAIFLRASQYGITEKRYMIIALSLWLTGITVYWLAAKRPRHIVIPISLSAVAFLAAVGPWNAFTVSKYSQLHRLERILERNHALKEGIADGRGIAFSLRDQTEISGIVRYLKDSHGDDALTLFPEADRKSGTATLIKKTLGFDIPQSGEYPDRMNRSFYFAESKMAMLDIGGYDRYCRSEALGGNVKISDGGSLRYDSAAYELVFTSASGKRTAVRLKDLIDSSAGLRENAADKNRCFIDDPADATAVFENGELRLKAVFTYVSAEWTPEWKVGKLSGANFVLFFSMK